MFFATQKYSSAYLASYFFPLILSTQSVQETRILKYQKGEKLDSDQFMMVLNSRYQREATDRITDQGDLLKAC